MDAAASHGYANPARSFAVGITKNLFRDGAVTPARVLSTLIDCIAL